MNRTHVSAGWWYSRMSATLATVVIVAVALMTGGNV
jgi:hypothetical protein